MSFARTCLWQSFNGPSTWFLIERLPTNLHHTIHPEWTNSWRITTQKISEMPNRQDYNYAKPEEFLGCTFLNMWVQHPKTTITQRPIKPPLSLSVRIDCNLNPHPNLQCNVNPRVGDCWWVTIYCDRNISS
jgi:hypothetical protein